MEVGSVSRWWFAFGVAKADVENKWQAAGRSSHGGSGSFDSVRVDLTKTVGTPFLVVEIAANATVSDGGTVTLVADLSARKLSGFDDRGRPVYRSAEQTREVGFADRGELTLPLLIADEREKASFSVHELILRLDATSFRTETETAYGVIAVSGDFPGAEILVDGGFVGRIRQGGPTLVENIRVGERDVLVRDFSGREVRRQVVVKSGVTTPVDLPVLPQRVAKGEQQLVALGKNPQGYDEFWRVADGAVMVDVPAGDFPMGSPEGQGESDERPLHQVFVSEFLIDKTEVTWRQFRKFAEAKGAALGRVPIWGAPDDYPACFILWEEARDYCEWVGGRLPTEAEWEKAAKGTVAQAYPWGDAWDARRCNSISGGMHRPESAGAYPKCLSPYGVLDMAGSVWEWCSDPYAPDYYPDSPSRDPQGPDSGRLRVMRGGAWMSQPNWLRAAFRSKASPSSRNVDHGFRCVRRAP
jgi:formylglycine-generating enzyme required for sulfatase activity